VAAACLRRIATDQFHRRRRHIAAEMACSWERINVSQGGALTGSPVIWELELLRLGTSRPPPSCRLKRKVVARINGDTTSVEPDSTAFVGIPASHSGLQITLHVDPTVLDGSAESRQEPYNHVGHVGHVGY
jgi:hypothetical protein